MENKKFTMVGQQKGFYLVKDSRSAFKCGKASLVYMVAQKTINLNGVKVEMPKIDVKEHYVVMGSFTRNNVIIGYRVMDNEGNKSNLNLMEIALLAGLGKLEDYSGNEFGMVFRLCRRSGRVEDKLTNIPVENLDSPEKWEHANSVIDSCYNAQEVWYSIVDEITDKSGKIVEYDILYSGSKRRIPAHGMVYRLTKGLIKTADKDLILDTLGVDKEAVYGLDKNKEYSVIYKKYSVGWGITDAEDKDNKTLLLMDKETGRVIRTLPNIETVAYIAGLFNVVDYHSYNGDFEKYGSVLSNRQLYCNIEHDCGYVKDGFTRVRFGLKGNTLDVPCEILCYFYGRLDSNTREFFDDSLNIKSNRFDFIRRVTGYDMVDINLMTSNGICYFDKIDDDTYIIEIMFSGKRIEVNKCTAWYILGKHKIAKVVKNPYITYNNYYIGSFKVKNSCFFESPEDGGKVYGQQEICK